jgi:hypothetical protein
MKKILLFVLASLLLSLSLSLYAKKDNEKDKDKDDEEKKDNPFSPYIQQRRQIMVRMNQHIYAYCSQALFNICDKSSLPVIPESGKIRRKVRFKNDTHLHEYYAYVQGSCMARLEDACEKTYDKRPIEYETRRDERKEARQWYAEDQRLRKELDKCADSSCRESVSKLIQKNNEEKSEENLTNMLNKKHRACLEWEKMSRNHEAIDHIDAILTQMKFQDADLLSFDLPVELKREIPEEIKDLYCRKLDKDEEEKSGKKPKKGKNGKDDDEDEEDNDKKGKGNGKNNKKDDDDDKKKGKGKGKGKNNNKGAAASSDSESVIDTSTQEAIAQTNSFSIAFDNKYSYENDFSTDGDLAFAKPTEEQKASLKSLSESIQTKSEEVVQEKLNGSCSQDSDCAVVQTQVNSCGGYNQTISVNQSEATFAEFKNKISELNKLSQEYISLKEKITGLNNKQYCPKGQVTPSAACVDSLCVSK